MHLNCEKIESIRRYVSQRFNKAGLRRFDDLRERLSKDEGREINWSEVCSFLESEGKMNPSKIHPEAERFGRLLIQPKKEIKIPQAAIDLGRLLEQPEPLVSKTNVQAERIGFWEAVSRFLREVERSITW